MCRTAFLGGLLLAILSTVTPAVRAQDTFLKTSSVEHLLVAGADKPRSPLPVTIDIPVSPESVLQQPLKADAPAALPPAVEGPVAANTACCACDIGFGQGVTPEHIFDRGQIEVQAMSGVAYHAFIGNVRSTGARMLFLPQSLRVGVSLNDPDPYKVFRGTWSAVAEWDTMPIVYGPGSILIGGSLGLRYTAAHRCSRLIPYTQFSFGAAYSDSYRRLTTAPPVLGQVPTGLTSGTEFLMSNVTGVHYLINSKWSMDAEVSTTLITNFGIAPNHKTLYPLGVAIGVTRYLR